jgi:hypothetical protein
MWINTRDGALVNLDQCHAMNMKEFRGAYIVTFDTASGHALQVKTGTKDECQAFFDDMAAQLTGVDTNAVAIVAALKEIAKAKTA